VKVQELHSDGARRSAPQGADSSYWDFPVGVFHLWRRENGGPNGVRRASTICEFLADDLREIKQLLPPGVAESEGLARLLHEVIAAYRADEAAWQEVAHRHDAAAEAAQVEMLPPCARRPLEAKWLTHRFATCLLRWAAWMFTWTRPSAENSGSSLEKGWTAEEGVKILLGYAAAVARQGRLSDEEVRNELGAARGELAVLVGAEVVNWPERGRRRETTCWM